MNIFNIYFWMPLITVYFVLHLIVFIHELGHYMNAKAVGVLCREFTIGVGFRIISLKFKSTRFTIRLIPIAGQVDLAGESGSDFDDHHDENVVLILNPRKKVAKIYISPKNSYKDVNQIDGTLVNFSLQGTLKVRINTPSGRLRSFELDNKARIYFGDDNTTIAPVAKRYWSKTYLQKLFIIIGGPFISILFAFLLFGISGSVYGTPMTNLTVGHIEEYSPAYRAKLQENDQIIQINNVEVHNDAQLSSELAKIKTNYSVYVLRNGQKVELIFQYIKVQNDQVVSLGFEAKREYSFISGLVYGIKATVALINAIVLTIVGFIQLRPQVHKFSGPLSLFMPQSQGSANILESVLSFTAMLSLNIGIFNLLPIPVLDGGRVLTETYEKVTKKPISSRFQTLFVIISLIMIVAFIILVSYSDIQKIFQK